MLRTREGFLSKIGKILTGKTWVDEEVLDQLEEVLITADVGAETTLKVIGGIQKRLETEKRISADKTTSILEQELSNILIENPFPGFAQVKADGTPYVVLVVGVNGVGKTTTIGKLASQFKKAGRSVILGAADTFRAAAAEQLSIWSERAGVPIISQGTNADPAAVAFDTVNAAVARQFDIVLIDTAGRLHNKANLMNELGKIRRVIQKVIPNAPHEVLLVLDATTGQNALEQCRQFTEVTQVTGLALTKLDGTAKGGVVVAISDRFKIPVKFIGVGEGVEDLQVFDKKEFSASMFNGMAEKA